MVTEATIYKRHPAIWAEEVLRFKPDPWQFEALESKERRLVYNCCRQSGKSTIAAMKALHMAVFYPGSLTLLISPSYRQSLELFQKVLTCIKVAEIDIPEPHVDDLRTYDNSRIISLPSKEETIRGYSAASLVIEDEAARVDDKTQEAIEPTLAVTNGQYIQLSTPKGKRGHFFKACYDGTSKVFTVPVSQITRITPEFLESYKTRHGSLIFAQEFLCQFIDLEGMTIKPEWVQIASARLPDMMMTVHSWDTAFKTGQENDFSVCTRWGVTENGFYLLDVHRNRWLFPDLKHMAVALYEKDRPEVVLIEDHASGQSLIQELMRDTNIPLLPIKQDKDKQTRLNAVSPLFESGRVFLPETASWKNDYLDELFAFPGGEHDDQVDSTTQALSYLKERGIEDTSSIINDHSTPIPNFGLQSKMPDYKVKAPWERDEGWDESGFVPY